jgi:predicted esterase
MRLLRGLYKVAYCFISIVGLPLSAWVLLHAQTWIGTALAIFGFSTLGFLTMFLFEKPKYIIFKRLRAGLFLLSTALFIIILSQVPTGNVSSNSPITHRFTKETRFPRFGISNIVPEIEQINLGLFVMTILDPFLTAEQVKRVGPPTLKIYHELEADPDFHNLGSVMGWAYDDVFGKPFDVGHYYLYVPKNAIKRPAPVIVFLHGSVGNFKAYLWVWRQLAEKQGAVIIAPSFGFGNWSLPESLNVVTKAIDHAATIVEIDRKHIYLAGISNGGLGTSQVGLSKPDLFRGLIFISPVLDEIIEEPSAVAAWKGRPMLFIAGEADERIPMRYVTDHIIDLKSAGVNVEEHLYPEQDHFLFFNVREQAIADVEKWFERMEIDVIVDPKKN